MRYVLILLLAGCAAQTPKEVGPYVPQDKSVPACKDVTVSKSAGNAHWPECDVK